MEIGKVDIFIVGGTRVGDTTIGGSGAGCLGAASRVRSTAGCTCSVAV